MDILTEDKLLEIKTQDDFDPVKIFECGQCFRWNAPENGDYVGVVRSAVARVRFENGTVYIKTSGGDAAAWRDYFDLETDYAEIRAGLCVDDYMRRCSQSGAGIRILRQEPWEALCSFIISQCNNIPRIKGIVERLCLNFGEKTEFEGREYYSFPAAEKIALLSEKDLAVIRAGYRAEYIINAARSVASGETDFAELDRMDAVSAKKEIMKLRGVGSKVADCFVLFGLHKLDAFPIDVWMKRAIAEHYGKGFSPEIFGAYAGLAQQYMFHYARNVSPEEKD